MSVQRRLAVSVAVAFLALVSLAACSSGGGDSSAQTAPPSPTVPSSTGDSCTDPTGDLSTDVKTGAGAGTDPAGIDLTAASATLGDDALAISFTTAGDIASAPNPLFVVAQGNPFDPLAFEIRAQRDDASGNWSVKLITWTDQEVSTPLVIAPDVSANTISFSVRRDGLPPIANYLQFGTSAKVEGIGTVFDECSSLSPATTVTTGG